MQTLGLSDSTARSEGRLRSLFWPSIRTGNDVDYLGMQGFWVCAVVAVLALGFLVFSGHFVIGGLVFLVYFLGGVGVRERSRYAAAVVLALFFVDTMTSVSIIKVILLGLLLSNLRATWIASRWSPASEEAVMPPRFGETWSDKFADKLPMWLWPKLRIGYYVLSVCMLALYATSVVALIRHRAN
jgi:hypothetical protein